MHERIKQYYETLETCTTDAERMNILFNIATCLLNLNKERVLQIADEIKEMAERNDDDMGRSYYHSARGRVFFKRGQYADCEAEFKQALEKVMLTTNLVEQASCLDSLGMVYGFQNRHQESLDVSLQALAIYEQVPGETSQKFKMVTFNNIGSVYKQLYRFEESEKSFLKGLAIAEILGDDKMKCNFTSNIAIIKIRQGEYDEGIARAQAALNGFRQGNHKNGQADTLIILAQCYLGKGEFANALTQYIAALKITKEVDHKTGEIIALYGMGNVYMKMDAFKEAVKHYQKALEGANAINHTSEQCEIHMLLGQAYQALGNAAAAASAFEGAMELAKKIGQHKEQAIRQKQSQLVG